MQISELAQKVPPQTVDNLLGAAATAGGSFGTWYSVTSDVVSLATVVLNLLLAMGGLAFLWYRYKMLKQGKQDPE